jgi:photosystem II stability/assembly factor-like uncharacterized protein
MKTILNILTICLSIVISNFTYGQWTTMQTTGFTQESKYDFITDNLGYSLDNGGSNITKTIDGGISWTGINYPSGGGSILDISFPIDSVGFVTTRTFSNATVYKTLDNGNTWQDVTPTSPNSGLTNNCFIQFIDNNVGFWSVGSQLYRTVDGGTSWTSTIVNNVHRSTSMHFFDANNGIIGGQGNPIFFANYNARVSVTSDGGQTFTDVNWNWSVSSSQVFVDQVSATTSFAAIDASFSILSELYRSTDSGVTWDTLHINTTVNNAELRVFDFIDELNGFAVLTGDIAETSYVYQTTDGGTTWTHNETLTIGIPYDIEMTPNSGYISGNSNPFAKYTPENLGVETVLGNDKFEVALYPNPVASGSVLNWDTEIDYNYLTIIDLSGQVVFSTNVIDKSLTVPVLGSGYYFIQFNNTFSKVSKSLVIE